jgi:hypothetical protein
LFLNSILMSTILICRTRAAGVLVFLSWLLPLAVHADKLDDNLQTVWESLWDERGTPRNLLRWDKPLTYTITGHEVDRHREHIQKAMRDAAQATQLQITEIVAPAETGGRTLLTFEIVKNDGLPDTMPCITYPQWTNWALTKVVVKMQSKGAWRCTFHEVMHAMGILGHPSGKTVLSYFAFQRDEFLPLDQLLLKAWYDPSMKNGATPLEALVSLSEAVAKQTDMGVPPELASERVRLFNLAAVEQVKALAMGTGEVPTIVKRSGRASTQFMDAAKPLTAYFVAQAYLRGTIVAADAAVASGWFRLSAQYGYSAGQVMWARALIKGTGVDIDLNAAHAWLAVAAKSNNSVARSELLALEKTMTPEQLEAVRLAPPPEVKVP